jgi:hypothetical protein
MSWNKSPEMFHMYKNVHKLVYILVSEHFSFAKIIHPSDRCGISRSWLNSMIITQLVLGTIKGHTKMCSFVTQRHRCLKLWGSVQLTCWLQECPPVLLPDNQMFISLPYAASVILENLEVRPTSLTTAFSQVGERFTDVNYQESS